jgi:hypothetical protein
MDIVDCFQDFIENSIIDYSDTNIILSYPDEVYTSFKYYALKHGFDEQTARDYFFNTVVAYCKDSLVDERLENLKEDFDD